MKKNLIFKPTLKHVLIDPVIDDTKKEEGKIVLTTEQRICPFTKAKVIDYSKDCQIFRELLSGQDRYVVVQTHMIDQVEIDGNVLYLIPESAIVLISSEV